MIRQWGLSFDQEDTLNNWMTSLSYNMNVDDNIVGKICNKVKSQAKITCNLGIWIAKITCIS